jgi:quinol monooxygenase YgiN
MQELIVVARIKAKKETLQNARRELLKLIVPTREEEGCIHYSLHQDNDDPTLFIFYEIWESQACLEQHMESDHFKAHLKATAGLIEEKAVHKMTIIK